MEELWLHGPRGGWLRTNSICLVLCKEAKKLTNAVRWWRSYEYTSVDLSFTVVKRLIKKTSA